MPRTAVLPREGRVTARQLEATGDRHDKNSWHYGLIWTWSFYIPPVVIYFVSTMDWKIWQLIDSAFPTGGFAHSAGLEASAQAGWVRTGPDAELFVIELMEQAVYGALPFVAAAAEGGGVAELDHHLHTMFSNHVASRASCLQGTAFLATAAETFENVDLRALRKCILAGKLHGHLPVMFGVVARTQHIGSATACRMYLQMTLRGVLSAGVRLSIFGPTEAQKLQARLASRLEDWAIVAGTLTLEDACQTSPLLELLQMGQDRLYSRLFQS